MPAKPIPALTLEAAPVNMAIWEEVAEATWIVVATAEQRPELQTVTVLVIGPLEEAPLLAPEPLFMLAVGLAQLVQTVVVKTVAVGTGELTTTVWTGTREPEEAAYWVTVMGTAAHPQATAEAGRVVAAGQMYSVDETGTVMVMTELPFFRGQLVTVGAQLEIVTTVVENWVEVATAPEETVWPLGLVRTAKSMPLAATAWPTSE
jgi:hypothetical protein